MTNSYSETWFELFLQTQPYTQREAAFVMRNLVNPPYRRVLDLCCGEGRHAGLLAEAGYAVVGVDRSCAALVKARQRSRTATFIQKDMQLIDELPGTFDAILSLWQSFGYFDETTNRDVLRQISEKLNPRGRFILDIYHRQYFERHQGLRQFERKGVTITSNNSMNDDRLIVHLSYGDGTEGDTFEWQLYTPDEICERAAEFDFRCCLICTDFDEQKAPSPTKPRMQLIFERDE